MDDERGGKRPHVETANGPQGGAGSGGGSNTPQAVMLADMQMLFQNFGSTIESCIAASNQCLVEGWSGQMRRMEERVEDQHRATTETIREIEGRTKQLHEGQKELWASIGRLSSAMSTLESSTPVPARGGSSFDRDTDSTVIQIRSSLEISKTEALKAVQEILKDMQYEQSWVRMGGREEISRFHMLRFTGATNLATQRTNKFRGLQKTANGWR